MSHIECPHCKTREHLSTYGLGGPFGGMSQYTVCLDCGRYLECHVDMEGLEEDDGSFQRKVDEAIAAQFVEGGKPIKREKRNYGGIHFDPTHHIPGSQT